jgi:hypothetical protein
MLRNSYWHKRLTLILVLGVSTAWADEKKSTQKNDCCPKSCDQKSCCEKAGCTGEENHSCCHKEGQASDSVAPMLPFLCCPYGGFCLGSPQSDSPKADWVHGVHPVGDLIQALSGCGLAPGADASEKTCADSCSTDGVQCLIDLIVHLVEPSSWAHSGGQGKISFDNENGVLVVGNTPQVHEKLGRLLWALLHRNDPMPPLPMPVGVPPPFMPGMLPPLPPAMMACAPNQGAMCPFQPMSLPLPVHHASMAPSGKAQQYELKTSLCNGSSQGAHCLQVQVCHVVEGQTAVCHWETQSEKGQQEALDLHCQIGPCAEDKVCVDLTVETGMQTGDENDETVREHRLSVHRQVRLGEDSQRMALDTSDESKAQRWLEFSVCKIDSEQLHAPKPCATNNVSACPTSLTPALYLPSSSSRGQLVAAKKDDKSEMEPKLTQIYCASTSPAPQQEPKEWVFQVIRNGRDSTIEASKGECVITGTHIKLKMADESVLEFGIAQGGCVTLDSDRFRAKATRIVIADGMDQVLLEGELALTYGNNKPIEIPAGVATWNVKDCTLECQLGKPFEK